jgi:futalosine hydrolase
MKLLIVSATEAEIAPLRAYLRSADGAAEVLITGVGMVATTYMLTKQLAANKYDLVLQAGVGGSFDPDIALGSVAFVTSDQFADLGAEDHDKYLDIYEMGLAGENDPPFTKGKLVTPLLPVHEKITLAQVSGITVNKVSGNEPTIKLRTEKYSCAVESMEGAAFLYVCLQEKVPFAQVRAISNYVAPRDKSQWKMKEAIANLNNWLIDFVENA